jgi:DNA-binding NtrC family response regulator
MITSKLYATAPRALVVEDDLWMQPLVTLALKSAIPGVEVDWAESVEEALRRTRHSHYEVIVADIHLKPNRETGIDLWYQCREECPEIPMLLTSSIPVEKFSERMGHYGPNYLPKPFSVNECKEVIKNLVSPIGPAS